MPRVRFTEELQKQVAALIDCAPANKPLTWDNVRSLAAGLGLHLTRQWLYESAPVSEAYRRHHEARKQDRKRKDVNSGRSEVDGLKHEVRRLRNMVDDADRRLVRWVHNAKQRNVTIEQLERPIPGLEA